MQGVPVIRVFHDWLLTPYRLAVHEPTSTAVIADVHLGYREARQQTGDAVPLLDIPAQLAPLHRARQRCRFERLVVAGDLFERGADARLFAEFIEVLAELEIEFAGLAPGNHDRGWEMSPDIKPIWPMGAKLDQWQVVHELP